MIDPLNVPPVAANELLARFIVNSNEFRHDGSVRPKLFMPYSLVKLSVNRHRDATMEETWGVGEIVAKERQKKLYGLANIRASQCQIETLSVIAEPLLPDNPNHADIVGYPEQKEEQLALATKLASNIEGRWIAAPT
jgi:hypothetical protein